jgi:hypothetical protein
MSEAMKKDLQAFEKAIAGYEKRQEAQHRASASAKSLKPMMVTSQTTWCFERQCDRVRALSFRPTINHRTAVSSHPRTSNHVRVV